MPKPGRVLFVCGLRQEARIAAGADSLAICGDGPALLGALERLCNERFRLVVSFGICGGLDASLCAGDIVLASRVLGEQTYETDRASAAILQKALESDGERVVVGRVVAVDRPVINVDAKSALHRKTGAVAVDMESAMAGAFAARHDIPFVVMRVVSDPANRNLPPLVLEATDASGGLRHGAIARNILRSPGQIPALIAAGRDSAKAFEALRRGYGSFARLFLGLGRPDL